MKNQAETSIAYFLAEMKENVEFFKKHEEEFSYIEEYNQLYIQRGLESFNV